MTMGVSGVQHMCDFFFFSSRRRHTRLQGDWSSDVCSSDPTAPGFMVEIMARVRSLGAAAPATSTAPTTRSASRTSRSMVAVVEYSVRSAEQIGRGSCRERGEISVVAGSLKKKRDERCDYLV